MSDLFETEIEVVGSNGNNLMKDGKKPVDKKDIDRKSVV